MTILVTGGTGFLGRHLVDKLVASHQAGRGEDVRVLTRSFNRELADMGVEVIEGSLDNPDDIARAIDGVTQVYHLAGKVERDRTRAHEMYAIHVDATRRLFRALSDQVKAGGPALQKIVYASSSGTVGVGKNADFLATDASPMAERIVGDWPYYLSKIYAERVCQHFIEHYDLPIVLMRPTLLLGPGDHTQSSTGDVVQFLQKKIPATMPGGISFVDVRDTADAFITAMERGTPGQTYLLGAANILLSDFFQRLEDISGVSAPKLPIPGKAATAGARFFDHALRAIGKTPEVDPASVEMAQYFWYINSSQAEKDLGFSPRPANETLRDTVRWIRTNDSIVGSSSNSKTARPAPPAEFVPRETVEFAKKIAGTHASRDD